MEMKKLSKLCVRGLDKKRDLNKVLYANTILKLLYLLLHVLMQSQYKAKQLIKQYK